MFFFNLHAHFHAQLRRHSDIALFEKDMDICAQEMSVLGVVRAMVFPRLDVLGLQEGHCLLAGDGTAAVAATRHRHLLNPRSARQGVRDARRERTALGYTKPPSGGVRYLRGVGFEPMPMTRPPEVQCLRLNAGQVVYQLLSVTPT